MKTRFLAMLLAVVMIASAALSVSAGYSDVTADVDHASAISTLAQLGVIGGYEDGTFKPENKITRAEMAKLVYVLYTTFVDAGEGAKTFDDVATDFWGNGYITWAFNKGIIGGMGDNKFAPNANVTYDQALKMVCGVLGYTEWDSALWPTDVRMVALKQLDLGEGLPSTLKGGDALTRAQVAQIMYNALTADMKETKVENEKVYQYDANDQITGYYLTPVEVPKTLAVDVWAFTEHVYTVTDTDVDTIDLDSTEYALEDLGLEAYEGKAANLIGLKVTLLEKDGEQLGTATINGSVTDDVKISYNTTRKTLKINGVEYTAKNFEVGAKAPLALYNLNGTANTSVTVFDGDSKLTTAFTNLIAPAAASMVRIIDVDGDGIVDRFVIVPKAAYVVTDVTTNVIDNKSVKVIKYVPANDLLAAPTTHIAANVTAELAKGDVFVGTLVNHTLYAEKVAPVETYATAIALTKGTITLKDVGTVDYKNISVANAKDLTGLTAAVLGADNKTTYYVYNGEVIFSDNINTLNDYNFAILKEVVEVEAEQSTGSIVAENTYKATLLVLEDGKLVEKVVTLGNENTVAGTTTIASDMYNAYKHTTTAAGGNSSLTIKVYPYALVAAYAEEDGAYNLVINADFDGAEDNYVVVPSGSTLKYNATTGLYTVGSYNKVVLNDASAIYYTYQDSTSTTPNFTYIAAYTKANITTKSFGTDGTLVTADVAYLLKNENGTHTLLTTKVAGEINGETSAVTSYLNDGRYILFAPEESTVVIEGDKKYNSYVFMDNATLTTKAPEVNKEAEYNASTNAGTIAGGLYGFNGTTYVQITAASGIATIKAATLADVIVAQNLVEFDNLNDADYAPDGFLKVADDVIIWGLEANDAEGNVVYKQFTLAELKGMLDDLNDSNTNYSASDYIDLLVIYDMDEDNKPVVTSIIVEVYEFEEDAQAASANDIIFTTYNA